MRKCPRCEGGHILKSTGIFHYYLEFCWMCRGKGRIPNPPYRKPEPRFYRKRYQRRKL